MGRAQGLAKDQFTYVMGAQRGSDDCSPERDAVLGTDPLLSAPCITHSGTERSTGSDTERAYTFSQFVEMAENRELAVYVAWEMVSGQDPYAWNMEDEPEFHQLLSISNVEALKAQIVQAS